ncbi:hypothetical protein OE88DRAFT_1733567 [Heliocybe sulcata]|uniref:Uncharacterized protein n=1 Tax=Heliocybe sulcata TaxID=5364 RepID=A0A5C3NCH4_9AGAM|nr:hypothetical protein OE88DRAFT_1733567 [Heliocybe sulcata]
MLDSAVTTIEFPNPFELRPSDQVQLTTLVERRLRALVGEILEKPDWWNKVREGEIVGKWRREFTEQDVEFIKNCWVWRPRARTPRNEGGEEEGYEEEEYYEEESRWSRNKSWPHTKITDAQLDYVFDWLIWLAGERNVHSGIEMTHIPNVYHSYNLISPDLTDSLLKGASILQSVPEEEKDWHPNSNNQVLDLVHPSLYCYHIGKSLAKHPETGSLYVPTIEEYIEKRLDIPIIYAPNEPVPSSTSIQHQWLPTDFSVSETGEVKHLSYINNLHPDDHRPLYATITSILEAFVPLWERVLTDVLSPQPPLIQVDPHNWYSKGHEIPREEDFRKEYPDDAQAAHEAYWEAYRTWDEEKCPFIPEPGPFTPPSDSKERVNFTLRGRTIQVVVKMANIVLTPDKPEYSGGSWHVEGMDNEKIVVTGIYYYDSSNVTESKLSFRTSLCDDLDIVYQNSDWSGFLKAYGISGSAGLLNQNLGHVATKKGKCLAFPNIWQHRVSPFRLVDRSKPGHRKILCFFLVDPTTSILSTSSVPPQQLEWYVRELEQVPLMKKLPLELFEMIVSWLKPNELREGGLITREQAKEERLMLMDERANFVIQQNEEVYELEFNMCEH